MVVLTHLHTQASKGICQGLEDSNHGMHEDMPP